MPMVEKLKNTGKHTNENLNHSQCYHPELITVDILESGCFCMHIYMVSMSPCLSKQKFNSCIILVDSDFLKTIVTSIGTQDFVHISHCFFRNKVP